MNDFDYDCMQKKRIAKNARYHVNARRGKCKLPHEYLSAKERNALNGEVKTYNLKAPMSYQTFSTMPRDLQDQYVAFLRGEMQATDAMIGEMWGYKAPWVCHLLQSYSYHRPRGSHLPKKEKEARDMKWAEFLGKTEEPVKEPEKSPEQSADEKSTADTAPVAAPSVDTPASIGGLQVQLNNVHSWEELYALCKQFPFPENHAAWVSVEVR